MTNSQIKLLSKMKKLIIENKRRFANRKDRDYIKELTDLGITETEAWIHILELNCHYYFRDPKPTYSKSVESLTFKKLINGYIAYIKLKIEYSIGDEETVCLSFHKDLKY